VRVSVIGSSGSGKSTFARRLADQLGLTHVELDALNWQPGWRDLHREDVPAFLARVAEATAGERWVTCGNYGVAQDVLLPRATHLVWLDYERPLIMRRVIRRSFIRALTKQELWAGTGNRELFRRWLDKEHPIRWAWDTFHRRRAQYEAKFADPALAHLEKHRLRHPREASQLLRRLAAHGQAEKAAPAKSEIFV
jgi:adenylate kinase family enzyme